MGRKDLQSRRIRLGGDYVKTDDFEADQTRQDDAFAADQEAQDELIAENRRSIEELEVTKGPVSRYETKGTSFNVASRNGDLYVNDATAANVTAISFAAFDLNGNPTRPVSTGTSLSLSKAPPSGLLVKFHASALSAAMTQAL